MQAINSITQSIKSIIRTIRMSLLVLILFGGFIALSIQSIQNLYLLSNGVKAKGSVIESYERKGVGRGKQHSYSIVAFKTAKNSRVTFKTSYYYDLSQKLSVLYDPTNPSKAIVNSFLQVWLEPLLVLLGSLIFIVFLWAYHKNRVRKA